MPFKVESLDNAFPRYLSAKRFEHWIRRDVSRFALVHRLDRLSEPFDALAHASILLHKIADCPERISDASGHCWSTANRDIGFHEIVIGVVQRDGSLEVFQFLRKRIREPR